MRLGRCRRCGSRVRFVAKAGRWSQRRRPPVLYQASICLRCALELIEQAAPTPLARAPMRVVEHWEMSTVEAAAETLKIWKGDPR